MIINFNLMLYSMIFGGIFLIIVDFLWAKLENFIPTLETFPSNLVEKKNFAWYFSCFLVELIFFVLVPAFIYDAFYTVLPFSGIRSGVSVGLYVFVFGMIPFAILLLFRLKIPAVYILYQLLGLLVKVVGAMAIIGYLYSI